MISPKEALLAALRAADITQQDWYFLILQDNPDAYARGYIQREVEFLMECQDSGEESFRDSLITVAGYNIWDQ